MLNLIIPIKINKTKQQTISTFDNNNNTTTEHLEQIYS